MHCPLTLTLNQSLTQTLILIQTLTQTVTATLILPLPLIPNFCCPFHIIRWILIVFIALLEMGEPGAATGSHSGAPVGLSLSSAPGAGQRGRI